MFLLVIGSTCNVGADAASEFCCVGAPKGFWPNAGAEGWPKAPVVLPDDGAPKADFGVGEIEPNGFAAAGCDGAPNAFGAGCEEKALELGCVGWPKGFDSVGRGGWPNGLTCAI